MNQLVVKQAITKTIKTEGDMMLENVIALIKMDNYTVTSFAAREGYDGPTTQIELRAGNTRISLTVVEGRS